MVRVPPHHDGVARTGRNRLATKATPTLHRVVTFLGRITARRPAYLKEGTQALKGFKASRVCGVLAIVLGVIHDRGDATLAGAMGATVERPISFDPMANDLATAVITGGSELVNGALKTVERVGCAVANDFKREVILVPADVAFRHGHENTRLPEVFRVLRD
jgi:hypothetical protein